MNIFAAIVLSSSLFPTYYPAENLPDTTVVLKEAEVVASLKQDADIRMEPISSSTFNMKSIATQRIESMKDLSISVPNFYIPDYGSRMTSSIYVRGLGVRIDQPVVGMIIDNIPYLNKNNFDFDFVDICRIQILRGPQSTLYGRNTIGGVIDIQTLSPFAYEGVRMGIDYGSAGTAGVKAALYHKINNDIALTAGVYYKRSDGFFKNKYDDSECDWSNVTGGRTRLIWRISDKWTLDNTFIASTANQGGYAYGYYDGKSLNPVNHNDICSYSRFNLSNGLSFRYAGDNILLSSVSSYQLTNDDMHLDQDFLPKSYFTLNQKQLEHAFTQDVVVKSKNTNNWWQWLFGIYGFYKNIDMDAPVTFKHDGIDELILANANNGIHSVFPGYDIEIKEKEFVVGTDLLLPDFGAAIYHQSKFTTGNWIFTAGLRADYEAPSMEYHNLADINYRFTMTMQNYKLLETKFDGREHMSFVELLPKLAVQYNHPAGNVFFSLAKGYKAGGFNTQLFSDILQSRMMNNMMLDLGVHLDNGGSTTYDSASATSYKPEYSWNYEIGSHLKLPGNSLTADLSMFYIDCRDQQLTVFPAGKRTGRMMTNAGHARSVGLEASLKYSHDNLLITATYGHTDARFIDFNDGNNDYSGNHIPYAPINTVYAGADYSIPVNLRWLDNISLHMDYNGIGKIYWNESNDMEQPFYGLFNSSLIINRGGYKLSFWGKNMLNCKYNTFYFMSVGNSFMQMSKPRQVGISLSIEL